MTPKRSDGTATYSSLFGLPLPVIERLVMEVRLYTGLSVEEWFNRQDERIEQTIKAMIRYIPETERIDSPIARGKDITLMRFVDDNGETPKPPNPAYAVMKNGGILYTLTQDAIEEKLFRAK